MNDYNSIEEIFNLIDSNHYDEHEYHNISALFQKYRDQTQKKDKKDQVELAQWNMFFLDFVIRENSLSPMFSDILDGKSVSEYPSLKLFDDRTYSHLKERFNKTENKYLKAKYGHLLWLSPHKHFDYAKEAVDNYFHIISEIETEERKTEKTLGLKLILYIKNLYLLCKQTNYRYHEAKNLLLKFMSDTTLKPKTSWRLLLDIGKIIKEDRKEFKPLTTFNLENRMWNFADQLINVKDFWPGIDILNLGKSFVDDNEKKKWYIKLGEVYEVLMKMNASELAALEMCQRAIYNYDLAKDFKKVEDLKKKSIELTKTLPLGSVKTGIDLSETLKKMEEEAIRMSEELSPEEIIHLLSSDKNILPKKTDMEKAAGDMIKNSPFLYFMDSTFHDNRGNLVKNITQDDKSYHFMLDNYRLQLYNLCIPFIHWIIYYSVANQKITAEFLIKLFSEHSWFGQDIQRHVFKRSISYNWLEAIMPSIHDYLEKLKYLENYNFHTNYIMCVDSLTLKVEGLIRDLLNIQGITTFKQRRDKKKIITSEKDLVDLLWDKKVIELFDEDDLLFLRFLMVEKTGYNLRNDVAHALLLPQQYNVELMHLLFLAILKIGKFNTTIRENEKDLENE
jgi:hypothetical protein